jgi:hypothetical protein
MSDLMAGYKYCSVHGGVHRGVCQNCAADRPDATALRLTTLSKTIDHLLARVADLERMVETQRRCIRDLEHGRIAAQAAHNALATAVEQLEARP